MRRITRAIKVGGIQVGGGAPVAIQSMCCTDTRDPKATAAQIAALEKEGCEIVRVAVPDMEAARAIYEIKNNISIPLVADIHFDFRLAIASAEAGADKIRINPGNIGDESKVRQVAKVCAERGLPIRIGVNSGSVSREILAEFGGPTAEALSRSAMDEVAVLEKYDFHDVCVSIKSSSVATTIAACRDFAAKTDIPLHLGVTEAGSVWSGAIKSAVGIGSLLCDGIGDTIRVSLTADPVEEVRAAKEILKDCGLRGGVQIVSCPTCGRTQIDLIGLANRVEKYFANCDKEIKIAVMGCVVNGPGEAREADIGIAGGKGEGIVFSHGEILRKVPESELFDALIAEAEKL